MRCNFSLQEEEKSGGEEGAPCQKLQVPEEPVCLLAEAHVPALGDPCPMAAVPMVFPEVPVYQVQVCGGVPILPFTKSPPLCVFIKLS